MRKGSGRAACLSPARLQLVYANDPVQSTHSGMYATCVWRAQPAHWLIPKLHMHMRPHMHMQPAWRVIGHLLMRHLLRTATPTPNLPLSQRSQAPTAAQEHRTYGKWCCQVQVKAQQPHKPFCGCCMSCRRKHHRPRRRCSCAYRFKASRLDTPACNPAPANAPRLPPPAAPSANQLGANGRNSNKGTNQSQQYMPSYANGLLHITWQCT